MTKLSGILTLVLSLGLIGYAQTNQEIPLVPGQSVEREIAGGEWHAYQITLTAGQFVRFRLEQRAIDAALNLTAPDGTQLVEMNLTGAGEEESLSMEAVTAGSYRLTILISGAATLRGSYLLGAAVQATATAQDSKRMAAERLLIEAYELEKQGSKTAQQVIEKSEQALPIWRELGEPSWVGWSLRKIGRAHQNLNRHEKAIEFYEQALAISREVKNRSLEGNALGGLGLTYNGMSRHEKAIELFEEALAISREVKSRSLEGTALTGLGLAYNGMSRQEKAIEYFEQALAIFRQLKDQSSEGNLLNSLGSAYGNLAQMEKAIEYFQQALTISRQMKDRVREGTALSNLGFAFVFLSRFEKAIEYLEQALAIRRETKNRRGEGFTLNALGGAYYNLRRFEKAIEFHEQAVAIFREVKFRVGEGDALFNLGLTYGSLGRYEKAIEYYEQGLVTFRDAKYRLGEGNALRNLGISFFSLHRDEKAIEHFEQSLAIFREVKYRRGEGDALEGLGQSYQRLSRPEKAIEYYEQALAIGREVKDLSFEVSVLHRVATVESERGNLPRARTLVEEGLRIAESLRSGVVSPESRTSFLASVQSSYQLYTDLLMRQHQAEPQRGLDALAVEVSERQRARSLLDLLIENRADLHQGIDPALIERERTLGKQLNKIAQTHANTPEQAATLKQEISQLETDYERAQAAIRSSSPRYAALVQPQPLKLKEIQQQLDAETLLLEYALGEKRSYLWAITKDTLTSYELPKGEQIKQSALQVYELLTARSTNKRGETRPQWGERIAQAEAKLPAAARELSQTLLAPVAAELGNKRLVIVADGALQYIPFAMLPEPSVVSRQLSVAKNNGPRNADNGQPLIVNHEVVSLPSASALAIQRTELAGRQLAPKMLAVIADPVFDRTDIRFTTPATETNDREDPQTIGFNDVRSIEHLADKSGDNSGVTTRRLVIPRLPFTRQEATRLLALTPKNSSFGAIDFQASRATVLDPALAQYRYVHFATHGLLDSERPGLSSLVLSMVDAQGKPQDGFLRANDIYNLKLPAELVVLSACQTGLGKEIKGEGLVGLTRGFMYAGAARVVVSLWNVNDKATADLMTKFYERMLKQGQRPAAALRAAQVEMWKQKQWQSPYYWAAFTMQGEWR